MTGHTPDFRSQDLQKLLELWYDILRSCNPAFDKGKQKIIF
jgi:hypothetical protein